MKGSCFGSRTLVITIIWMRWECWRRWKWVIAEPRGKAVEFWIGGAGGAGGVWAGDSEDTGSLSWRKQVLPLRLRSGSG